MGNVKIGGIDTVLPENWVAAINWEKPNKVEGYLDENTGLLFALRIEKPPLSVPEDIGWASWLP